MSGLGGALNVGRRTILSGTAAILAVGVPEVSAALTSQFEQRRTVQEGAFTPEVPKNPDNPHLISTHGTPAITAQHGWEQATHDTVTSSILDLGVDVMSYQDITAFSGPPLDAGYPSRLTEIGEFAYRWGLSHSGGFTRILKTEKVHQEWYQDLPDDGRWTRPDGSQVQHPKELAARRFDGEPHLWAQRPSEVIPSVFARPTLNYEATVGSQVHQLGANQLFVDGFELGRLHGSDFSVWARVAFRDHLRSLSEVRLDGLGIDDPGSFDIRTYLKEQGVAPGSGTENPAVDPVYREYTRRHHQRHKRYAEQLADRSTGGAPPAVRSAGTTFFGNLAGIAGLRPAPIYLSDAVDEVNIEVDPTLPPARPHDVTVKIGLAAGRFEKPLRIEGKMMRDTDTLHGLDPTQQYPVLMQFQAAQPYAHGGIRGLPLTGFANVHEENVVNNWVKADGRIDESLHRFTDFIRSSKRFLNQAARANDAVLIVSLPTLIWQRAPQWGLHNPPHSNAVRGAASVLRREHIPYDVVIFDYPPVWGAPTQHESIQGYDLVVLPGVESISDPQVASLEAALANGARVVATGGAPPRSEEYQHRDDVRTLLQEAASAEIIDSNPERSSVGSGREALRNTLATVDPQVELGTDGDISVNVMRGSEGDTILVHLLNFEYDPEADSMPVRTDVSVTVHDLPFEPAIARYHAPHGVSELDLSTDGGNATFEIPTLEVWGFVVLGATASDGKPTTDRSTASGKIEDAKQAVSTAEENGRTTRLVQATAALDNAEAAFEYGAFTQAHRFATESIEATAGAYRTAVIGIDRAHNQSNEYFESDLSSLRETFDTYEYRMIKAWDPETLGTLDLLIVPPIAPSSNHDYGFNTAELEALQEFVHSGGSLVLLGIHHPKSGFNRLAGKFGFGLDGRPITKGRGDYWSFDVDSPLSAVTAFIPTWPGTFGTAVDPVGEGTVLGRVTADHDAWLNEEGPIEEQGPDDPAAAGEPVLVGRAHGDGHVIISGEAWQFVDPRNPDDEPAPLPRQILRVLGRRARYAHRSEQSSPTPSSTTPRTPTTTTPEGPKTSSPERTTGGQSGPGFGLTVGLGGVAGAVGLLKWLRGHEDRP